MIIGQDTKIIEAVCRETSVAGNVSKDFLSEVTPDLIFSGERYYTRSRFAEAIGLSVSTLAGYATRGRGPEYIKIGKSVLYGEKAARSWMRTLVVDPKLKR